MSEFTDLKNANPVEAEHDWGNSPEGRMAFQALIDNVEAGSHVASPNRKIRRPWIFAIAGFAVTIAVLIPVFFAGGAPEPDPLSVPGNPYWTISDDVLADGVVTTDEFLFGADAVVSCTQTLSEEPDTVVTYEIGSDRGISFTYSDEEAFEPCHTRIFSGIEKIWGNQNGPSRASDFYFYTSVVVCTEATTGQDYGEMTRDPMGFVSTVGHRTINAALDAAEGAYLTCFNSSFDQVAMYNQVLACVEVHSDTNYEDLGTRYEDRSIFGLITNIDEPGFATLDQALEANPELFFQCLENVTKN